MQQLTAHQTSMHAFKKAARKIAVFKRCNVKTIAAKLAYSSFIYYKNCNCKYLRFFCTKVLNNSMQNNSNLTRKQVCYLQKHVVAVQQYIAKNYSNF